MPARHPILIVTAMLSVALLTSCSAPAAPSPLEKTGPGGTGAVSADGGTDADTGPGSSQVSSDSACDLAAASSALASLGAVGTPVDTSFVAALSMCDLTIDAPDGVVTSMEVSLLTSQDVALTADSDPESFGGSVVALPELGDHGHFLARVAGVDPTADPPAGAILAARGDLGVSIVWSMSEPVVPYSIFEQAVRELLDALP